MTLLENVHCGLKVPCLGETSLIKGNYSYYHYSCDGFKDAGWGCGYRTLQTLCSFLKENFKPNVEVPNIKKIQSTLVEMDDKPSTFLGSRQWIGSVEVGLVIDSLYDIPCKIIHVSNGSQLKDHFPTLEAHFKEKGSPVMMGGNEDCASKGILGVHRGPDRYFLLVLDPHLGKRPGSAQEVQNLNYVCWVNIDDFNKSSFYNFCLPQNQ